MSEGDGELLCRVAENHRVVIRCVVENREPLEGVRFALSRTAVPFEHPTFGAEDVTLADNHAGAHAMFVGQTDAGGMLVLDGLPAGSYPFDIEAEGHVCVAGPDPDEETLAVPSGALEFVFRRVHVALAKLSGGAVVASSQSSPGTLDTTGARSSRELRRIRMSLQQSHPDCFLHLVGVPRASLASDYRATANVLLRHGGALGWKAVHVPFVPFRSELQPVVIDPAGMTIAAVGQLTVTLRTPGGTAIRGAEFSLQELEGGRSHPPLWPSTGDELSVPAGEYQLRFSDRALRRDVGPQRVVVTAGNETTVPLATTTEMKPYRIRLRAVEGDPAWGGVTIVVTPEGGRPRVFGGDSLVSTRVLWAPAGSLRVQVMAGGYAPIDRGVDLAADCPSGVHEIDLILSPDQPLASTR